MPKILETIVISAATVPEAETTHFGGKASLEMQVFNEATDQWEDSPQRNPRTSVISNTPVLCPVTIPELAGETIKDVRRWITDPKELYADLPWCAVVPMMGAKDYQLFEKTVRVTLTAEEWNAYLEGDDDIIESKIKAGIGSRDGIFVSSSRVTNQNPAKRRDGWTVDETTNIATARGRSKTVYRLKIDGVVDSGTEYTTVPSAGAAVKRVLHGRNDVSTIEVVAEVQKEGGASLMTFQREIHSVTASFRVTLARIANNPTVTDYVVSFWCFRSK